MNQFAVEVKNLSVSFGDFVAVKNVSFSVEQGKVFGFLGANGAGKTTTIRVLCGLLEPTSGDVSIAGMHLKDNLNKIKNKIGYMSQRTTLYEDLTVWENLEFRASVRKILSNIAREKTKELLEFVGFYKPLNTPVKDLPPGIKQQVSLVAAILHEPDIIFLDEPTAGVTPRARSRFWELIRGLSESGKTLIVTTHYLDEAEHCDSIGLMRNGELIALSDPQTLKKKTFPEDIFEITPPSSKLDWIKKLSSNSAVKSVVPYGMHYHVVINDISIWESVLEKELKGFKVRRILPSLEYVFIRLVEGK